MASAISRGSERRLARRWWLAKGLAVEEHLIVVARRREKAVQVRRVAKNVTSSVPLEGRSGRQPPVMRKARQGGSREVD